MNPLYVASNSCVNSRGVNNCTIKSSANNAHHKSHLFLVPNFNPQRSSRISNTSIPSSNHNLAFAFMLLSWKFRELIIFTVIPIPLCLSSSVKMASTNFILNVITLEILWISIQSCTKVWRKNGQPCFHHVTICQAIFITDTCWTPTPFEVVDLFLHLAFILSVSSACWTPSTFSSIATVAGSGEVSLAIKEMHIKSLLDVNFSFYGILDQLLTQNVSTAWRVGFYTPRISLIFPNKWKFTVAVKFKNNLHVVIFIGIRNVGICF